MGVGAKVRERGSRGKRRRRGRRRRRRGRSGRRRNRKISITNNTETQRIYLAVKTSQGGVVRQLNVSKRFTCNETKHSLPLAK